MRESEADEDYEDIAAKTEADRQRQPLKRRFGVKLTRLSGRLPAITSYFSRGSRSPRDDDDGVKDRPETSRKQSDMPPQQPAGHPATAVSQCEISELPLVSTQDPSSHLVLAPANVQFSASPILSVP